MIRYSEKTLKYFYNDDLVGTLPDETEHLGTGMGGNIHYGDVIRIQIQCSSNQDDAVIEKARFKAYGSVASIACAALATSWIEGMSIAGAYQIKSLDIAKGADIPEVTFHAALLAEDAVKRAIDDIRQSKTSE